MPNAVTDLLAPPSRRQVPPTVEPPIGAKPAKTTPAKGTGTNVRAAREAALTPMVPANTAPPAAAGEICRQAPNERPPPSNLSFALRRPGSFTSTASSFAQHAHPSPLPHNLRPMRVT